MELLILFFTLVAFVFQGAAADSWKTESDLRRDLFKDYDKLVRPVRNHTTPIKTSASIIPLYLQELDEHKGKLVMDLWMTMLWKDEYLQWNPNNYNGIDRITLPSSEVWKPDLVLFTGSPTGTTLPQEVIQVHVWNDGRVMWIPPFTISNRCPLPSHKGLRKIVTCRLQIGSWTYSAKEMILEKFGEVEVNRFQDTNPDWQLLSMNSDVEMKRYGAVDDFLFINFNATFKRRTSSYYITSAGNSLFLASCSVCQALMTPVSVFMALLLINRLHKYL